MITILILAAIPFSFGCLLWAAGWIYQRVRRAQFAKVASQPELKLIRGGK